MLTSFTSIFSSHFYVPNQIGFPNDDNISIKNEALQKVALPDLCDSYACVCNIFYKSINQNLAKSTNSCISRYQIHQWTGSSFNFNMSSLVLDVAQHCQHAWLLWPGRISQGCTCQKLHVLSSKGTYVAGSRPHQIAKACLKTLLSKKMGQMEMIQWEKVTLTFWFIFISIRNLNFCWTSRTVHHQSVVTMK